MTHPRFLFLLLLLLLAACPACGIPISASEPLVFVAPLEGDWELETDPNTAFRVTVPGGQPLYDAAFDFTADIETPGGTTSYDGTADGEDITLRDPGSGAVLLTGTLLGNTMLALSDGRTFTKPFLPELVGVWQDVNRDERFYVLQTQQGAAGTATGCAALQLGESSAGEVEGALSVTYAGDSIPVWLVESESRLLKVRAPALFVGYSAIRVKRIDGYIHLQRVDRSEGCP